MVRFLLLVLLLVLSSGCQDIHTDEPPPEPTPKPIITAYMPSVYLQTSYKTSTKINFTTSENWSIFVSSKKADTSWISIDKIAGFAGNVEITAQITESNPSSLNQREIYLQIVSDTAFRTTTIIQPPRPTTDIAVAGIILNKSDMKLTVGGCQTLIATVLPENATNQNVTYSSSNPDVATVSLNGVINGVRNGTATITATTIDADKIAKCNITVFVIGDSGGQINDWN